MLGEALRAARTAAGTQQIIGCTTAGELTERGLSHGGVTVLLVSAPKSVVETAARSAAQEAKANLQGAKRAGVCCSSTACAAA